MGRKFAIDIDAAVARTRAALAVHGLLLLSDKALPSIAGATVGEPIRGSWWAHPLCHEIYEVSQHLHDDPKVVALKFLNGKTTFLAHNLWPYLYAIGTAREPWQMQGLTPEAKALLSKLSERGAARADELAGGKPLKDVRPDLVTLEERLLVFTSQEHTETGAHLKRYESWPHWAQRVRWKPRNAWNGSDARARFDRIGDAVAGETGRVAFPWTAKKPAKRARSGALTARRS